MTDRPSAASGFSRRRFTTRDVGEAEAHLGTVYTGGLSMGMSGDRSGFECRHDMVASYGVAVNRLWNGMAIISTVEHLDGQVVVGQIHAGRGVWRSPLFGEVTAGAGDTVLLPPVAEFTSTTEGLDLDLLVLDLDEVAEYAEYRCGVPVDKLEFHALTPVSEAMHRLWRSTVAHVRDELLDNVSVRDDPTVVDSAVGVLCASLLTVFPNTASDAVADRGPAQLDPRLR